MDAVGPPRLRMRSSLRAFVRSSARRFALAAALLVAVAWAGVGASAQEPPEPPELEPYRPERFVGQL